jgi:hypothetical protein
MPCHSKYPARRWGSAARPGSAVSVNKQYCGLAPLEEWQRRPDGSCCHRTAVPGDGGSRSNRRGLPRWRQQQRPAGIEDHRLDRWPRGSVTIRVSRQDDEIGQAGLFLHDLAHRTSRFTPAGGQSTRGRLAASFRRICAMPVAEHIKDQPRRCRRPGLLICRELDQPAGAGMDAASIGACSSGWGLMHRVSTCAWKASATTKAAASPPAFDVFSVTGTKSVLIIRFLPLHFPAAFYFPTGLKH